MDNEKCEHHIPGCFMAQIKHFDALTLTPKKHVFLKETFWIFVVEKLPKRF